MSMETFFFSFPQGELFCCVLSKCAGEDFSREPPKMDLESVIKISTCIGVGYFLQCAAGSSKFVEDQGYVRMRACIS